MAFARHYYSVVNETAVHPKIGKLEPLALPGCKTCDNHEETVETLVHRKQHFTHDEVVIDSTSIYQWESQTSKVTVMTTEPAVDVVDANGHVVKAYERLTGEGMVFELRWGESGWRVAAIRVQSM